jgi:hypothetical protein
VGKNWPKKFTYVIKKATKKNNRPIGENSPNLVTPVTTPVLKKCTTPRSSLVRFKTKNVSSALKTL